jgi:hypothetical protein
MPKIINLADASTYTLGAAANIFLPSQVGSPHFNYSNMSNLLGDPTNLICTFGSKVNSYGENGYRFVRTKNAVSLARYDYLKYFVSQPNGNGPADWGNHQPDLSTSYNWYSINQKSWKYYINFKAYDSPFTPSTFFTTYGVFPETLDPINPNLNANLFAIIYFPTTGTYTFTVSSDNSAVIYINGIQVVSNSLNYTSSTNYSVSVTAGYNILRINLTDTYAPSGVALQILNPDSSVLWSTTPGYYGSTTANESIFLQYSTNNSTWINLQETTPFPTGTTGWNPITFKIPDSIKSSSVWLRLLALQTNPYDATNNINNDGDNWAVSSLEGVTVNPQCPINFNDPASYTVGDSIQSQVLLPSNINSANIGGVASPNRKMNPLGNRTDVKIGLFGHTATDISTSTSINRIFTSTNSYTLRYYKGVSFYLNKGGGEWGDPPDSGEDFYLQYSTDNTNWITIATGSADSIPTNVWTKIEYTGFPDSIKNTPIYFRYTMNQWVGSYKQNDNWAFSSLEFIGGA